MGLGLDWSGNMVLLEKLAFGVLTEILECLWVSYQRKGWAGQGQEKMRSGSGTLDRERLH